MATADWSAIFEALSNDHRRRLLVSLLEHNPQDDRVTIPEEIDEGEEDLEGLQLQMFHQHLPKLEEMGFVRWDRDAHEVLKGPRLDEIRPLLELIDSHHDELPEGWI